MRSPGREKKVYIPAMWDRSTVHDDEAKNLVGCKCVKIFFFFFFCHGRYKNIKRTIYKNGYYNLCKIRKRKEGKGKEETERNGRRKKAVTRDMDRRVLIIFIINYKKEKREKVKRKRRGMKRWKEVMVERWVLLFLIK